MKRTDEATWKESFSINYRALGLWRKMAGRFLLALTLSTALEALAPYIPLVFTARLLDEIAGARDPARLTTLCVLLLSISTLTLLLAAACFAAPRCSAGGCAHSRSARSLTMIRLRARISSAALPSGAYSVTPCPVANAS